MDKIDRVISAVRRLNEEAPTNNVSGGQIAGTVEAGDDPPVRVGSKRIYMKGLRKWWKQMTQQTTGKNK
jgi:hypothetical protein